MQKINKEAEVYSKVGRLFNKAQEKQVVEGLNKQTTSSGKQLIRLKKDKISLRNQLYESKISYRELISMEPVECLSFTHCPPPLPLSGKKVCVTFDVFTDLRLQEGPQCGAVALVVAAGVMRQEGIIIVDEVMDLVIENEFRKGRRH